MAGWTSPRTWVTSEVVTAALLNQHVRDNLNALNGFVRKTTDESVTSSTTLQDDNELSITIPATGTYIIDLYAIAVSATNSAGDIKISASTPTGTLYQWAIGPHNSVASSQGDGEWIANFSSTPFGATTSPGVSIHLRFLLVATATGTFQIQWAQNSSNANATTVKAGSHLEMKQVA